MTLLYEAAHVLLVAGPWLYTAAVFAGGIIAGVLIREYWQ
jgi:hypothetical protein